MAKIRLLYYAYLFLFALDSLVNYEYDIPLLAATTPFFSFAVFLICRKAARGLISLLLLPIFLSLGINSVRHATLAAVDITDAFAVSLFISVAILAYDRNGNFNIKKKDIYWTAVVALLLFFPTFFGVDAGSYQNTLNDTSSDIEFLRAYHQGLFRFPHIAAYFLSFLALVFFFYFRRSKKIIELAISALLFGLAAYTGSRAGVYAAAASLVFLGAGPIFSMSGAAAIFLLVSNLDFFLALTRNNFAFQYLSFFDTLINNPERLSRFMIWSEWLDSVNKFTLMDFLIGGQYSTSLAINQAALGRSIWFHNDWLSVIFSYGLFGIVPYIACYFFLYRGLKKAGGDARIVMIVLAISLFLSLANGFYYYHPLLLIAAISVVLAAPKISAGARQ